MHKNVFFFLIRFAFCESVSFRMKIEMNSYHQEEISEKCFNRLNIFLIKAARKRHVLKISNNCRLFPRMKTSATMKKRFCQILKDLEETATKKQHPKSNDRLYVCTFNLWAQKRVGHARHSDMGPSLKREQKKVPFKKRMRCFKPFFITKWHTLKHVKDQLGMMRKTGFRLLTFIKMELWKFSNPIYENFESITSYKVEENCQEDLIRVQMKNLPWCCRNRLSLDHSVLPRSGVGVQTCILYRDVNIYCAETLDTLPVEAIASLFRSIS